MHPPPQISSEFVYFEPHVEHGVGSVRKGPPTPMTSSSKSSSYSSLESSHSQKCGPVCVRVCFVDICLSSFVLIRACLCLPVCLFAVCLCPPRSDEVTEVGAPGPVGALPKQSCKRWSVRMLTAACPRRYLLRRCALELFFEDGGSVFLAFEDAKQATKALNALVGLYHPLFSEVKSMKASKQLQALRTTDRWRKRELSNFDCTRRVCVPVLRACVDVCVPVCLSLRPCVCFDCDPLCNCVLFTLNLSPPPPRSCRPNGVELPGQPLLQRHHAVPGVPLGAQRLHQ